MSDCLYKSGLEEQSFVLLFVVLVQAFINFTWSFFLLTGFNWFTSFLGEIDFELSVELRFMIALAWASIRFLYEAITLSRPVLRVSEGKIYFPKFWWFSQSIALETVKEIAVRGGDMEEIYFDVTLSNGVKTSFCSRMYFGDYDEAREFVRRILAV